MITNEQRIDGVFRGLSRIRDSNNAWMSASKMFDGTDLSREWRNKILRRLTDYGYLERQGENTRAYYRFSTRRNNVELFDKELLSKVLWPSGIMPREEVNGVEDSDAENNVSTEIMEVEGEPVDDVQIDTLPKDIELLSKIAEGVSNQSRFLVKFYGKFEELENKVSALEAAVNSRTTSSSTEDLLVDTAAKLEKRVDQLEKSFDMDQLSDGIVHAITAALKHITTKSVAVPASSSSLDDVKKELAVIHELFDKRNKELGQAFKTLVDAIGDHRKLDDTARDNLISTIIQAINLNNKETNKNLDHLQSGFNRVGSKIANIEANMHAIDKTFDQSAASYMELVKAVVTISKLFKEPSSILTSPLSGSSSLPMLAQIDTGITNQDKKAKT